MKTVETDPDTPAPVTAGQECHLADRATWEAFLAGYQAGITEGMTRGVQHGRAEANQEWTDVTTFACRSMRGWVSHAELTRRRSAFSAPALTAEEIRERTARSWGLTDQL